MPPKNMASSLIKQFFLARGGPSSGGYLYQKSPTILGCHGTSLEVVATTLKMVVPFGR